MKRLVRPANIALITILLLNTLAVTDRTVLAHDPGAMLIQPAQQKQPQLIKGVFESSVVFPGTTRDYAMYIPKAYRTDTPANLMVFQDGRGFMNPNGPFRVPEVFERLISEGSMPVTIAVFVNPGTMKATLEGAASRSNRSFEYDSLGDRYARFLIDEFLPVALTGLNVSDNPADRAICGNSSGGICAFTVAWERPDQFGKVMSHIGSFTNIRGGWRYPGLVRKSHKAPKPIKVYLQDGVDDLSNLHGSWPLSNRDLAAALQFSGYTYRLKMTEGGHSGKWAGQIFADGLKWLWDDNAKSDHVPNPATKPDWQPHPDAVAKDDVPKGDVIAMPAWESSKVFPGTTRNWWVYVPAQYKADQPAAVMVFQDGERMQQQWRWRVPTIFDNLIAKGDMPVTIGIFINPGHDMLKSRKGNKSSNRGFEYDSVSDRYVTFLADEILPEVRKQWNLSEDPDMHAIGGSSSGGICAFTAAWERPDLFRKVYSSVGSFTHLRGGNIYPALVRKTEPKPIRIYMADTSGDVDNAFGSWWWANQRMAASLQYMGYDLRFDQAEGYGHNPDFGSSKLPDALTWLWRQEKHSPQIDTSDDLKSDFTLLDLLVPDESWQVAVDGLGFADGLCSDDSGNLYFCDMQAPAVYRIDAVTRKQTVVARESVSGLEFAPGQKTLYACQGSKNRIIAIDVESGDVKAVAENVKPNDLEVTGDGYILFTQTRTSEVVRVDPKSGQTDVVADGIVRPNGITLSNDGGTLAVSSHGSDVTWTFRVNPGGKLDAKMPSMPMRLRVDLKGEFQFNEEPPYVKASRGDGMCVDRAGRYYVTSDLGVQIFDPTCRPCGLLPRPDADQPLTSCVLAGSDHSTLYIAQGKTIYRRKLTVDRKQ